MTEDIEGELHLRHALVYIVDTRNYWYDKLAIETVSVINRARIKLKPGKVIEENPPRYGV